MNVSGLRSWSARTVSFAAATIFYDRRQHIFPRRSSTPLQEIASLTVPLMEQHGVEPVCQELHIAPATYYWQRKRLQNPELRSVRQRRDEELGREIERVYDENKRLYGVKKVWLQLRREGVKVGRCTVERLMRAMGLVGIRRGKGVKTTCRDKDAATPDDLVNRRFMTERPNQLWVADFTYVSTAQGFVYVAFIVDVFAGVIVG